jgi:hypothetical protein
VNGATSTAPARRGDDVGRHRAQRGVPPLADQLAVRRGQPMRRQHLADEPVEQRVGDGVEIEQRQAQRRGERPAERRLAAARHPRDDHHRDISHRAAPLTRQCHALTIAHEDTGVMTPES